MKYVLVIGDGMADEPIEALNGKTPLGFLDLDGFDRLASCEIGLCQTVPAGVPAGSDTAILNIFGCDPRKYYTGRSVLEAAGVDVLLKEGQVSFRVNLCAIHEENGALIIDSHNGGSIEGDEAENLMTALVNDPRFLKTAAALGLIIHISRTFRHIGVLNGPVEETAVFDIMEPHNILEKDIAPYYPKGARAELLTALMKTSYEILKDHPINLARQKEGKLPANMIWPWGAGRAAILPDFNRSYGHRGDVISAVPLVWGIANLCGLPAPKVAGANGDLDTNYEGKVEAALQSLRSGDDFTAIHVEAPDEMSHAGDMEKKLEALRRLNERVINPLLEKLPQLGDFRLLFLSDHPTLLSTRTHDGKAVPYAIFDSRKDQGLKHKFDEAHAAQGVFIHEGDTLMGRLFEKQG